MKSEEDVALKLKEAAAKRDLCKAEFEGSLAAARRERDGEVWYWQGDGADHLESLTCPVLIEAEDLRAIFERAKKAEEALNNVVERHTTGRGEMN